MNAQLQTEQFRQKEYWFLYRVGNFFVTAFFFIVIANDHSFIGFVGLIIQAIFNFVRVPALAEKFEDRLKMIAFKTQIENLYVYSRYEGQNDSTVVDAFKRTVNLLKESGNVHEVRVNLVLFRDVKIFTWFFDRSGKLVKNSTWRAPGSANETWEEYQVFIEQFEKEDREERLRQLRKDNVGFDWVNENLFGQWETKNS